MINYKFTGLILVSNIVINLYKYYTHLPYGKNIKIIIEEDREFTIWYEDWIHCFSGRF